MASLPRVFALRFKNGQLVGGAALHDVRCVGGETYRLAGGDDLAAALPRLPVAPQAADVEELLPGLPGTHALRVQDRQHDWVAGAEAGRVALKGSAWVVCVGGERAPSWLAALVAGADPQVVQRLLAGAMLKVAAPGEVEPAAPRAPRSSDFEYRAPQVQSGRAEKRRLDSLAPAALGVGLLNTLLLLALCWFAWTSRPAPPDQAPEPTPSAPAADSSPSPQPSASPVGEKKPSPSPSAAPRQQRERRRRSG